MTGWNPTPTRETGSDSESVRRAHFERVLKPLTLPSSPEGERGFGRHSQKSLRIL